jgi:hypothetical protein
MFKELRQSCIAYEDAKKQWYDIYEKACSEGVAIVMFPECFVDIEALKQNETIAVSFGFNGSFNSDEIRIVAENYSTIYRALVASRVGMSKERRDTLDFRQHIKYRFGDKLKQEAPNIKLNLVSTHD